MFGYILAGIIGMCVSAVVIGYIHGRKKPIGTIKIMNDSDDGSDYLFLELDTPIVNWIDCNNVLVKVQKHN